MADFDKVDMMIKISGKVDKPTLKTVTAMIFHSLLKKRISSECKWVFLRFSN